MIKHVKPKDDSRYCPLPLQQGSSGVLDYADFKTRASLAQTFEIECNAREREECPAFTLVVNHLKSKGSDCDGINDPDVGDGQASTYLSILVSWWCSSKLHTHTPLNSATKVAPSYCGHQQFLVETLKKATYPTRCRQALNPARLRIGVLHCSGATGKLPPKTPPIYCFDGRRLQ